MFRSKTILIVEDNAYTALDLATAVEGLGGTVAGPVATAEDALSIIATDPIAAAIVDADVANIAMLASALDQAGVPMIFQAGSRLTAAVKQRAKAAPILYRPVDPATVISMLSIAIGKTEQGLA